MNSFFGKIFGKREVTATPGDGQSGQTPQQPEVRNGGSYDENIVRIRHQDKALTIAAVYRAIEVRMKTMSQIEPEFQSWDRAGQYFRKAMYGADRRLNYLLQVQPNPMMSSEIFWQMAEFNKITFGNAFVYIERDDEGWPYWLWLCDGWGSYDPIRGVYTLTYQGEHGQVCVQADRRDVLHVPNTYKYYGSIMGIPTLQFACETLTLQATNRAQAKDNAAKGGKMKLIIGEDKPAQGAGTLAFGLMNKDSMNDYAREVNDLFYMQDVIALRNLDKVTPISMNAQQLQLLEQMNFGIPEVARFYAVPKALLMDDSNASYKTPSEATQELLNRTISPAAEEWMAELTRKILTPMDYGLWRFEAKIGKLFKFDRKATSEINKTKIETGVASPNELRLEMNMPKVEDGDTYFVSANLKPIREAAMMQELTMGKPANASGGEGAGEGGNE